MTNEDLVANLFWPVCSCEVFPEQICPWHGKPIDPKRCNSTTFARQELANHLAESNWPECEEFYNLMQRYRHAPIEQQSEVVAAYEEIKSWLRAVLQRNGVTKP